MRYICSVSPHRLRGEACSDSKAAKSIPQGLKPILILLAYARDKSMAYRPNEFFRSPRRDKPLLPPAIPACNWSMKAKLLDAKGFHGVELGGAGGGKPDCDEGYRGQDERYGAEYERIP